MEKKLVMIKVYHQNQHDVLLGNYFAVAEGSVVYTKNIGGFGNFELTYITGPVTEEPIRVHNLGQIIPTFGQNVIILFGTRVDDTQCVKS